MTSIASSNKAAATPTTSSSVTSSSAHQRTPSSSGQTTPSAAVTACAPAPRQASLSYANVVTSKKAPTGPGAAVSSNTAPQVSGGPTAQHARSASTTSVPVNGRIQPAVPQIGNSGNTIANGASSAPYSGGQHSRKSSLAGNMPNGRAPNIKFGAINEPGSGPQSSGTAVAAGNNLTAPVAPNPRASSPSSPSLAPQPVASGGAPPTAGSTRQIQFGDATQHQTRPTSMPPVGPGSMGPHNPGHHRRDSAQSAHGEGGPPVPHGRGMPPAGRGRQPYGSNQFQNPTYGYGRGGYSQGPNQTRNGPNNMGAPAPYPQQQYPHSPRHAHRTPTMPHASPSMSTVVPTTTQLYPPPAPQPYIPGSPHYPVQQMYDPNYYHPQYNMGYQPQYAQTSPRPQFSQVPPMAGGGYVPSYPQPGAPMSRSSSNNVPEMHSARPPSSMGQHPTPSMTPQPQALVSPPQPGTPGPPGSPYGPNRGKKPPSKAIEIKNPSTGAAVKIEPKVPAAPVVAAPSAPVIVSSPSPGPGSSRQATRDSGHSRSTSRSKNAEEKRQEMRNSVLKSIADAEKLAEQKLKQDEEERKKKDEQEKAEQKRKEEEEANAKKLAEEQAQKEAEEKIKREAEAKAEEERLAKEKAAKEQEEKEALEKAQKLKEEEEAKQAEEAKLEAEKSASSTPVTVPDVPKSSTPDSESMPPPSLKSIEKPKIKPSPLNLQLKTNEPAPPSAALTALRSARPVDNLKHLQYPEGILSPNPALNPLASVIKFKYDKDFLMQFQTVFTEKPSVDWDLRMRETVGDTESARPGTARTPLGMGPRSTSRSGPSNMPPPMGSMGTFGSFGKPGSSMTGMDRFPKPSTTTNPLDRFNSLGRQGPGLVRTNSSTSLSGSSHQIPPSPRTGNRSSRGSKRGGAGGSSMERTDSRQSQGGPTIPLADVKPLEASASRWKPISIGKKPAAVAAEVAPGGEPDNRMAPEMVQRKVKAALNKMTPEKFDKIADQILEITSQSKFESDGRTLRQVIQLTFEKATDEAHWASMYAKFCKRMLETMDPNIKDENIRDKNQQVVTGGNLFRKYLLNRCQEEFERGWKVNLPPKPEGESEEAAVMLSDDYYIAAAAKRRGLGLVQFIGELFKLGMLTERIMNECVRKLLDFEGVPEDETVESLTKLLRTIGSQLDSSEKSRPVMDIYFGRIKAMIDNKELNSRMRFMLMDICDLRNAKWESKETNKGPMTIQEIKAEAVKAQQEKEAASRANRGNRPQAGRGDARSFSHGGGYGGGGMHPPGGFHDNKSGGIVSQDDLRKLNNRGSRQNTSAQNFGPSSMFANNTRSSSGSGSRRGLGLGASRGDDSGSGSRNATPPAPASTSSPNPFSLLENSSHPNDSADANDAISPPASKTGSPQVSNAKLEKLRSSPAPTTEESK